jgi:hypothetical protein
MQLQGWSLQNHDVSSVISSVISMLQLSTLAAVDCLLPCFSCLQCARQAHLGVEKHQW